MSCVLKDFFLATPMSNLEFMKIRYKYITDNIREKYDLGSKLVQDGYIYICQNKKGMHGLKHAVILAFDNLIKKLPTHGLTPVTDTIRI